MEVSFLCFTMIYSTEEQEFLDKLGCRLRHFRQEKYGTAEEGAFHYKIQRSQYTRYESGHNLNYLTLVKILAKMEIPLSEFFEEGFD